MIMLRVSCSTSLRSKPILREGLEAMSKDDDEADRSQGHGRATGCSVGTTLGRFARLVLEGSRCTIGD